MRIKMTAFATLLLAAAVPALAADAPPPGRLPDTVTPIAYRLNLNVDPAQPRFTGHTEIDVTLKAATNRIFIHGRDLAVTRVQGLTGRMVANPGHYREVLPTGVAEITFDRPLQPGRQTITLDYSAAFQSGAQGLYRQKVGDEWYAWTQFESIDARRAFPGFDEPGFKVPFTVSITAPTRLKVFSNAPELAATPTNGPTTHRFAQTKPLPTYLVALAVGPFDVRTAPVPTNSVRAAPLTMRGIAEAGQGPRLAFTMREGPKLVSLLEQYFGIAYPYPKLDTAASPIMGGAMENAGLIIYDDTIVLTDPNAPPGQTLALGSVIAHEVAHQWFGDLVTPTWWTDIWLNESFATWAAQKIATRWNPKAGVEVTQLNRSLEAMSLDSQAAGRPIRQAITRNEDIDSAFDSITYEKGGQVLRMMEGYVGEDAFQKGVHLHLTRYAHKNADGDDFFRSIAEGSGHPEVIPAFRSFVEQQGVPLVTVSRAGGGAYALKQERYVPIGVAPPAAAQRWQVPVCARSGEGRQCTLLADTTGTLPLTGTAPWVMPNAGATGYYRFDLDPASWDALIAASPTLPATEAMATADSLWSSFAAGRAPFKTVLAGARALAAHPERYAATSIPGEMDRLSQTAFGSGDRVAYGRFVAALFGPRLAALGLDPREGAYQRETTEQRNLRRVLATYVALDAGDPATRATLARAANASLGGDKAALDPEYRSLALTVAAQDGGEPVVRRIFEAGATSADPLFRAQAGQALSGIDRAALAPLLLSLSEDKRLRGREPLYLIGGLSGRASTRDAAYTYAVRNFDRLVASSSLIASRVVGVGGGFCSEADARRVEADLRPKVAQYHLSPLELDRTVEQVRQCAALKAAKGAEISAGLTGAATVAAR